MVGMVVAMNADQIWTLVPLGPLWVLYPVVPQWSSTSLLSYWVTSDSWPRDGLALAQVRPMSAQGSPQEVRPRVSTHLCLGMEINNLSFALFLEMTIYGLDRVHQTGNCETGFTAFMDCEKLSSKYWLTTVYPTRLFFFQVVMKRKSKSLFCHSGKVKNTQQARLWVYVSIVTMVA